MNFEITRIELDEENQMLRFGFGKNKGSWFVRIDLWTVGYRLKKKQEDDTN